MSQTAVLTPPVVTNGVNVSAMMDVIAAVQGDPEIGKFNFRLTNNWIEGDRNRSTITDFSGALARHRTDGKAFVFENGEHQVLLGHDEAPNPVEWLLHALIGCMTTTTAYHCAARGIEVGAIESEVDGDVDLRGFLGLSDEVRKGYSQIRVRMRVETSASPDSIRAITDFSPVKDVVGRSVPIDVTVETY